MTITIKESKILKLQMKGFIFCGDSVIIPENTSEREVFYLEGCGYEIMGTD